MARRKMERLDIVREFGFTIQVPPTVFHPSLFRSSRLFASYLNGIDFTGKSVLDVGCGSGILSLIAASKGAKVTAVDINPESVRITSENAIANNLRDKIVSLKSDLFCDLPKGSIFDTIIVNPPYYPGLPVTIADHAWKGGNNYEYFERFGSNVDKKMGNNAEILIILSSDSDLHKIINIITSNRIKLEPVKKYKKLFEELTIYRGIVT